MHGASCLADGAGLPVALPAALLTYVGRGQRGAALNGGLVPATSSEHGVRLLRPSRESGITCGAFLACLRQERGWWGAAPL